MGVVNRIKKFFDKYKNPQNIEEEIRKTNSKRQLTGFYRYLAFVLGAGLTAMVFYTSFNGVFLPMIQIGTTLCILLALTFLWIPGFRGSRQDQPDPLDLLLIVLCFICLFWTLTNNQRFITRIPYYSEVMLMDKLVGFALVLMVLEGARRTVGLPICIIVLIFIFYAFLGNYMPAMLQHRGFTTSKFIDVVYLTTEGLFGSLTSLCASVLFVFVSFGTLLSATGADRLFMDLALAVAGRSAGGPAKVAVVSSGAMGMISGSSVANVVTTGTLTIPMMKKMGFKPHEAGAVEAVASSGGQITPPVMGTVAFLIADNIGYAYFDIVKYSFLPALMFYCTVWLFVDCMAKKKKMKGIPREELPSKRQALWKALPLLIPIAVLTWMLYKRYTPFMSGSVCTLLILLVTLFRKDTRLTVKRFFLAMENCAISMTSIINVVACASIIIGLISKTGLMIKSTSIIMYLSGGMLMPIILIMLVMSYIIGCGLPSATCYIILATLCAPALANFGIKPLEAHLVIFWFSQVAGLTPPVCITAFVAAGVADADPMLTGFQSLKMGSSFYFLPMFFLFSPLISGTIPQILMTFVIGTAAIYMFVAGIEGFLQSAATPPWMRLGCFAASLLLFFSCVDARINYVEPIKTVAGLGIGAALLLIQYRRQKQSISNAL
ncbi:MAG: TRAP transporter fused permease subunit [Clostridiales bacterium]